ncbi:MAG: ribokinase [Planctomycetota bacterium]|jgi:ribokinase
MSQQPTLLVVGSVNMDLIVRAPHIPEPGETVLGKGFATAPGGKGANQAVAIARQGARCLFLGMVGEDGFGEALIEGMKSDGVDCENIIVSPEAATGVAMIIVDAKGENSIVVASGANYQVTPDDVYHAESLFETADVVVLQLELPLPTVRAARALAAKNNCRIVLDPAPAPRALPAELCKVDVITPNVSEAEIITGQKVEKLDERVDKLVASDLIERGAKAAVLKLGARGSLVLTADGEIARIRPYKVDIVDTTAAGDAFTAALAVGLARNVPLIEAARAANAAGALACTRFGAQPSMPTADEIQVLMIDQKP